MQRPSTAIGDPASAMEWATSPAILLALVAIGFALSLAGERRWQLRIWLICARFVEIGALVIAAWAIAPVPSRALHWAWRVGPWTLCAIATAAIVGGWTFASGVMRARHATTTKRRRREAIDYRHEVDAASMRGTDRRATWTLRLVRRALGRGTWGIGRMMCALGVAWLAAVGLFRPRSVLSNWMPSPLVSTRHLVDDIGQPIGDLLATANQRVERATLRARGSESCVDLSNVVEAVVHRDCATIDLSPRQDARIELARDLHCRVPPTQRFVQIDPSDPVTRASSATRRIEALCTGAPPFGFVSESEVSDR